MIPISYRGNVDSGEGEKPLVYAEYLEDYYKTLMPKNSSANVDGLNAWCRANISLDKETVGNEWTFKDVVCASPENVVKIKYLIDNLTGKEKRALVNVSGYVVRELYLKRMRKYGARELLEKSAMVHVCPYCNRNLTKQISINDKFKTTCELDHFFPKGGNKGADLDGYSLLAVSYFNLIPVCHYCNMTKGENELKAFYPYGFGWKEANRIRLTYYPLKCDYMDDPESLDVVLKIDTPDSENDDMYYSYDRWRYEDVLSDIGTLQLSEIYQNNRYEVQRILKKNMVYNDTYSEMIYRGFKSHFSSVQEVSDLMTDRVRNDSDIANVVLGKLRHDINKEISDN